MYRSPKQTADEFNDFCFHFDQLLNEKNEFHTTHPFYLYFVISLFCQSHDSLMITTNEGSQLESLTYYPWLTLANV